MQASIKKWGNTLAVRLSKGIAKAAGGMEGTRVAISARPGRIIVEIAEKEPTLAEMLNAFDPKRHAGEAMAFLSVRAEAGHSQGACHATQDRGTD